MAHGVTVHLIRHEKTKANRERRYIGWTDEPILNRVQAQLAIQPKVVFGSDLVRCRETSLCYFPQAQFIACQNLRELNFGDFEMCTYEELKHNKTYRTWIDNPLHTTIPNGESFLQFQQRVVQGFHEFVKQNGDYTFVVHGGVIRLLLAKYGVYDQTFQQTIANHRTRYTLTWEHVDDLIGGARCTLYSEAHIMVNEPM